MSHVREHLSEAFEVDSGLDGNHWLSARAEFLRNTSKPTPRRMRRLRYAVAAAALVVASWTGLRAPMAYEIPLATYIDFQWHTRYSIREVPDRADLQRFVSTWFENPDEVAVFTSWRAGYQAVHIGLPGDFAAAPRLVSELSAEFQVLAKASVEIGTERDRIAGTLGGWLGVHDDPRATEARARAVNALMHRHGVPGDGMHIRAVTHFHPSIDPQDRALEVSPTESWSGDQFEEGLETNIKETVRRLGWDPADIRIDYVWNADRTFCDVYVTPR
ncbi:MAG: hypothetical protein AAFP04_15770 [Myxococcota bacterium]